MKTPLKHFLRDIRYGENIDIYITLALSLILAVLGVVGTIQVAILTAGILATLGVLAYSVLATRRILGELSQALASFYPAEIVPLKDRSAFGAFRDELQKVSTVWLQGPSLVGMLAANKDLFREILRKGGEIHVLTLNPSSSRLSILAEHLGARPSKLKSEINTTIENCTELVQSGLGAGKFEVRQMEMMPGYSMVICNPYGHDGRITVEYTSYHVPASERPHLQLDAKRDRQWFTFYLNQFDELWQSATSYTFDDLYDINS